MKKKIIKIIFVCLAFVFLFSVTVLPSLAFTSVNGWEDFSPNMPSMELFYKMYGQTSVFTPRSLAGYVSYTGTRNSVQTINGNSMRTFKASSSLGYQFTTTYAVELFVDFVYLPFVASANASENAYQLDLSLTFTTDSSDSSVNPVHVKIGYITSEGAFKSKSFTYHLSNDDTVNLNAFTILNDSSAHALNYVQIGYDYSGEVFAESKYVDGQITISNFNSWVTYDPYVNAVNNLYSYAYNNGYNTALVELGGATAEEFYNRGYENGFNAGRIEGYQEGYNQATNDTSNANYQSGYQAGYTAGYQAYANSVESQLNAKYTEGYNLGRTEGYKQGELVGVDEGYTIGFDEGYDWGYDTGYDEGISKNIEEVGLFNYIVSSCNAIFQIPLGKTFTLGGLLAVIISIPLLLALIKLLGA